MKKRIYSFKITEKKNLLILGLSFSILYGCKKTELKIENKEQYTTVFMQSASNGAIEKKLAIKDQWTTIPFGAGYGGFNILSNAVQVDFTINPAQVELYNKTNNTNYELPPADSYRLDENQVVIQPGNAGSNNISLEINPLKLGGTKTYLLPISINKVSPTLTINEKLSTTYYLVNGFYETNPFTPIAIEKWKILDFSDDDYDAVGGRAPFCIDGNVNTVWLSTYRRVNGWRPPHPHYVTIDMNNEHTLHGITLFGRRGTSNAGLFPKNVMIQTSSDGNIWTDIGIFNIAASSDDTSATMNFEKSTNCRYFKVTVLSSAGNGDTTSIAELVAF